MKLFQRRFGQGEPVVILHGLLGLSDNWVTFGKALGTHYSVYVPDLRNHGRSPHSPVFDYPSLEADLLEMLEDSGLDSVALIGHSLGGKTAMYFTLHHPEYVRKLVIVDISLRETLPAEENLRMIGAMRSVDLGTAKSRGDVEVQLRERVKSERLRQFILKNIYWRDRQTMDWRPDLEAIHENLMNVYEGTGETGMFRGPVLFIRGGLSDYLPDTDIPLLKSKFPGARVHTVANASHWVHADAPGEFFEVVKAFLDGDQ